MKDKRNYRKMITTKLQSLAGKQNISTVFFDWVHMMAYAFSNSVDKGQYEEREAAYLATVVKIYEGRSFSAYGLLRIA
ncbi:hypothetical protein [Enterococcus casseliflavus]|uniref:hypothetical protein n=1 Tax=Enterococcus casseliflavus TaxID=37734 RepID=UPI0021B099E8|nr:hypothetical protein [Enterococcus casseliflavus]